MWLEERSATELRATSPPAPTDRPPKCPRPRSQAAFRYVLEHQVLGVVVVSPPAAGTLLDGMPQALFSLAWDKVKMAKIDIQLK